MSHIFISYSRKDQIYARQLADELLRRGFDVWIDDKIDYGDRWQRVIFKAIDDCAAIIVLMTPDSAESEWVEREYNYAHKRKKPQFPILLEGEEFPFYVTSHFVDARDGTLPQENFYAKLRRVAQPKDSRGAEITAQSTPHSSRTQGGEQTDTPNAIPVGMKHSSPYEPAEDNRQFPFIIKPDWVGRIIPEPFEWCLIPSGEVTLHPSGEKLDYVQTPQAVHVAGFQIARYPITSSQFEAFVMARDGWRNVEWWNYSDNARTWRAENRQPETPSFGRCATCPRVDVTWYESVAFTQWLSAITNEDISLPTEVQWQYAAQGSDARIYPWGNVWEEKRCNASTDGSGKPSPVTQFPLGESPYGVYDMSGNVWEWSLTEFITGNSSIAGEIGRVVRGGSWIEGRHSARTLSRQAWNPYVRGTDIGFRIAQAENVTEFS